MSSPFLGRFDSRGTSGLSAFTSVSLDQKAHRIISTDALSHPNWGVLTVPYTFSGTHLPPMLHLAHYACRFPEDQDYDNDCEVQDSNYAGVPHQHQLLWQIRLNRGTLKHLQFERMLLSSLLVTRDICRTVSQLDHLRTLQLTFLSDFNSISPQFLRKLFFSCPTSLVEFKIRGDVDSSQHVAEMKPRRGDWDFTQGSLVLRKEPLYHLQFLELPHVVDSSQSYPANFICSILKHCPALKTLELPSIINKGVINACAITLDEFCPLLKDLALHTECDTNGGGGLMIIISQISGP